MYSLNPCVPHNERACTSCANLALCVSKRSMHSSAFFCQAFALACLVRFFLENLAEFSACFWERPGSAPVSCSHHVCIKCADIFNIHKRDLPQISIQFAYQSRHHRQIPSAKCCNLGAVLPMVWQKLSVSLRWSCKVLVQTFLVKDCRQHLLVRRVVLLTLLRHSFCPVQAAHSDFHCDWHTFRIWMQLFGRNLLQLWLAVPIFPRHCKEPSRQLVLACVRQEEFVFHEAPILSCKKTKTRKKRALYGCLEIVALIFLIYLRFPELMHHVPRVPGCNNSCFPLRGEGHVPSQAAAQLASPSSLSSPQGAPDVPHVPVPFGLTLPRRHVPSSSGSVKCPTPPWPC